MTNRSLFLLEIAPLLVMLVWAAIEDFRTRRIRNWLTLSMVISGIAGSFFTFSLITPGQSLLGFAIGFGLPFVLFVLGAVGGGDVKLLAGIGAWLGPVAVFKVFCAQAIIGMIIVLVQCAMQGRLKILGRNTAALTMNLIHLDQVGLQEASLAGKACRSVERPLPFAVPVLIAVVALTLLQLFW